MKSAACRTYRGHLIIVSKSRLLGRPRFEVWQGSTPVGTFGDLIAAELHVDRRLGPRR